MKYIDMESEIRHVCSLNQMFLDSNEMITSRYGLCLLQIFPRLTQGACRHFLGVITTLCCKLMFGTDCI